MTIRFQPARSEIEATVLRHPLECFAPNVTETDAFSGRLAYRLPSAIDPKDFGPRATAKWSSDDNRAG